VIGQELAARWPEIVAAAAKPFGEIDQLIVLNGAQGISETLAQALSQGAAGLAMARKLLSVGTGAPETPGPASQPDGSNAQRHAAEAETAPAPVAPVRPTRPRSQR
jgi:hypothetical protein